MSTTKELKARYRKAIRRVERESDVIETARDRKRYWQSQVKVLKDRIKLVQEGQLEFPI